MPTHTMQMCLHACTQTECEDAKHFLSGSHQIPSASDHCPPLSTCQLSPTTPHASLSTPHHEPCIRTLAEELEDAEFRTPYSPGGSEPDPKDPNDPDDDDNNTSEPSIKDNPILVLTNTITHLSNATRCRPEDSGAARTKVCCRPSTQMHGRSALPSFLKGIDLTWFEPDLLDAIPGTDPTWADDYSEFVIKLTTNFGPHDPVSDAKHQLNNLSMKDSS
ncbi:hypothetical protein ID866_12817 [Astraeus odoratus]|nr:hypothetical protein ID866_12817 [Astraeus odoratus]